MTEFRKADRSEFTKIAKLYNNSFSYWLCLMGNKFDYGPVTAGDVAKWNSTEISGKSEIWTLHDKGELIGFAHINLDEGMRESSIKSVHVVPNNWQIGQSRFGVAPSLSREYTEQLLDYLLSRYKDEVTIMTFRSYNTNEEMNKNLQEFGFVSEDIIYFTPFSTTKPYATSATIVQKDLRGKLKPIEYDSDVSVRMVDIGDLAGIRSLSGKEYLTRWHHEYLSGKLGHVVIVAESRGKIVGLADYRANGHIRIRELVEGPNRINIGKQLVHYLLTDMRVRGIEAAISFCDATETDEIEIYRQIGLDTDLVRKVWVKELKDSIVI